MPPLASRSQSPAGRQAHPRRGSTASATRHATADSKNRLVSHQADTTRTAAIRLESLESVSLHIKLTQVQAWSRTRRSLTGVSSVADLVLGSAAVARLSRSFFGCATASTSTTAVTSALRRASALWLARLKCSKQGQLAQEV